MSIGKWSKKFIATAAKSSNRQQLEIYAKMVQAIVANAVGTALGAQEERLKSESASELESVRVQVTVLTVQAPQVQDYQRVLPNREIKCQNRHYKIYANI